MRDRDPRHCHVATAVAVVFETYKRQHAYLVLYEKVCCYASHSAPRCLTLASHLAPLVRYAAHLPHTLHRSCAMPHAVHRAAACTLTQSSL